MNLRRSISVPCLSYCSGSGAQDTCCQVSWVHVSSFFVSHWAEHLSVFLSFQSWGGQLGATARVLSETHTEESEAEGDVSSSGGLRFASALVWLAELHFEDLDVRI